MWLFALIRTESVSGNKCEAFQRLSCLEKIWWSQRTKNITADDKTRRIHYIVEDKIQLKKIAM